MRKASAPPRPKKKRLASLWSALGCLALLVGFVLLSLGWSYGGSWLVDWVGKLPVALRVVVWVAVML